MVPLGPGGVEAKKSRPANNFSKGIGVTPLQGEPPAPVLFFPRRKQRRPGPVNPTYAIPRDQWPDVLRHAEQGES